MQTNTNTSQGEGEFIENERLQRSIPEAIADLKQLLSQDTEMDKERIQTVVDELKAHKKLLTDGLNTPRSAGMALNEGLIFSTISDIHIVLSNSTLEELGILYEDSVSGL